VLQFAYFSSYKKATTMNTKTTHPNSIDPILLTRYVEMRHKVDIEANSIFAISSILALLDKSGDDVIKVDPIALGKINQLLNTNILNIWEILDDYISIVQAKLDLGLFEK
jgi:hypothetical protein